MEWSPNKAYQQAAQASGCLLAVVIPIALLLGGCLGCAFYPNRSRMIALFLSGPALILIHIFFGSCIADKKRWAVHAMLILASLEILVFFSGYVYILIMMDWRHDLGPSLAVFLVLTAVLLTMIANWIEIHKVRGIALIDSRSESRGFEVIVNPDDSERKG